MQAPDLHRNLHPGAFQPMATKISKDNISGQYIHVSTEAADAYTRGLLSPCQYIRTSLKLPTIRAMMIDHSEVSRVPKQRQARLDNPEAELPPVVKPGQPPEEP